MTNVAIGGCIALVVGLSALLMRSRRRFDAPTQRTFSVPVQIDRGDFGWPEEPWLVIVFTSSTCAVCADVSAKAQVLSSRSVGTRTIDYASDPDLHKRYGIDAVPTLVIADSQGVVRHHVLGPVSATDLWAAVAAVRNGSGPMPAECSSH